MNFGNKCRYLWYKVRVGATGKIKEKIRKSWNLIEENKVTKKIYRCIFWLCFAFSSFSFQKVHFLMENSQMINQLHKRDFIGYALNFSFEFVFLSFKKVKCYTRYTKDILVAYVF